MKIRGFHITNAVGRSVNLFIYDVVGFEGTDASTVVKKITDLDVDVINVRINSPGGLVFDGYAIYNALVAHKATVVVHIDGLAASIASVIAMAGDEIIMAENAQLMIHLPTVGVRGQSKSLRDQADVLDQLTASITDIYIARTGLTKEVVQDMMTKETWMNASMALEKKFVTKIGAKLKVAACVDKFDLAVLNYSNAPKDSEFPAFPLDEEKPTSPDFAHKNRVRRLALVNHQY